ncbi:hypothetical protein C3L33_19317, partial [Rhododendron williamsianum]
MSDKKDYITNSCTQLMRQLCDVYDSDKTKVIDGVDFRILRFSFHSNCYELDGVDDSHEYLATRRAMDIVGISEEEQEAIFRVVAAILHIGNIEFAKGKEIDSSVIKDEKSRFHLNMTAELHMCVAKSLEDALIQRVMVTPEEVITRTLGPDSALGSRDALAKTTYSLLFDRIVEKINISIGQDPNSKSIIGVLDIYGFESFKHNSANVAPVLRKGKDVEEHVFKMEQEEYTKEEINWSYIEIVDNQDVMDLIEKVFNLSAYGGGGVPTVAVVASEVTLRMRRVDSILPTRSLEWACGVLFRIGSPRTEEEEEGGVSYMKDYQGYTRFINGLFCLYTADRVSICNFSTREIMDLPAPPNRFFQNCHHYLGFDSTTNEYKVLKVCSVKCRKEEEEEEEEEEGGENLYFESKFDILTLGKDMSWRSLHDAPAIDAWKLSTCINGRLYWWDPAGRKLIHFSFNNERFGFTSRPPRTPRNVGAIHQFRGDLALLVGFVDQALALWVFESGLSQIIEDNGETQDVKAYSWCLRHIQVPYAIANRNLKFLEDLPTGEVLMTGIEEAANSNSNSPFPMPIYSYDHTSRKFEKFITGKNYPSSRRKHARQFQVYYYEEDIMPLDHLITNKKTRHETVAEMSWLVLLQLNKQLLPPIGVEMIKKAFEKNS